jgi:myosin heavy subunit
MVVNPKIGKLILIGLIIILLALAGAAFALFQQEHNKSLSLQTQLEDAQSKQRMAESRLDESKKMISELQGKLQDSQTQIETLNSDMQKEKDVKQEALALVEQLKSDLENQKEMRAALEKKVAQAQEEIGRVQAQVKELEGRRKELEDKLKELASAPKAPETKPAGVELGKIVVGPETKPEVPEEQTAAPEEETSASTKSLSGKILVINKDYNFAVTNLGSKDGIVIGDVFSVYHKNRYVGDIKVEKVHDVMSAAGFVTANIKNKISEGDKVILKTK